VLTAALRAEFADEVDVAEPRGGFFAWARLAGDIDFAQLFERSQDMGVTYQRGEWFATTGDAFRGFARLSFSEVSEQELTEGVARLAQAWRELTGRD
jgi:DNA-binding transcriptional MocR family regulator